MTIESAGLWRGPFRRAGTFRGHSSLHGQKRSGDAIEGLLHGAMGPRRQSRERTCLDDVDLVQQLDTKTGVLRGIEIPGQSRKIRLTKGTEECLEVGLGYGSFPGRPQNFAFLHD